MKKQLQRWLDRDPDPVTRTELQSLLESGNRDELNRRFSTRLKFGTAGLRGVVGGGPARMNRLVIRESSAGLGSYLLQQIGDAAQRGVVVAFDGRTDSRTFARDAACVLAALGIKVYFTPRETATPIAAFGVLYFNAAAGVVVTASHNPPEYNGVKVYWENGAQIIPPHDTGIAAAIEMASDGEIPWVTFEDAVTAGTIVVLDEEFYRGYLDAIQNSPLFQSDKSPTSTGIAYTAMHGVGAAIAETLLGDAGFDKVYSVGSQRDPDGRFPTVAFPNPEEPGAMDAVLALAREHETTLACANDPDADRLAVAVRTPEGDYQLLTGDMLGVLLANYLLSKPHPFIPIVCTTIVSSSMLRSVARAAGADYYETLTGFKWLANTAFSHEDGEHQFLFAYEEALGYAPGRQVRDKDGLSALLAFAQMTESLAHEGKTVLDQLHSLYLQHGIYLTAQRSMALQADARPVGELLRKAPPEHIGGHRVMQLDDFSVGTRRAADGSLEELDFPRSDVLVYRLDNSSRVIVRPSGTEPKVKCYYEVVEKVADGALDSGMAHARSSLTRLIDAHQTAVAQLCDAEV
ncbi:MAG: phospho-sugar mutase [Gammaproteobacteria bacterium]|nr:phospho-sugar mutase [Gammaproteobacteria bacterium]